MIYIVTGLMRTGTSLMMQILRKAGIPPHYSEAYEARGMKGRLRNKAFLEAKECIRGDISKVPDGACVKVFLNALEHVDLDPSKHKVLAMWRPWEDRFRSMRHKLNKREWEAYQQKCTHANREVEIGYERLCTRFPAHLVVKFNSLFDDTTATLAEVAQYTGLPAINECRSVIEQSERHFNNG